MIIENKLNDYNFANLGITSVILGVNYENFKINKKILSEQENTKEFENKLLCLLNQLLENQKEMIELIKIKNKK